MDVDKYLVPIRLRFVQTNPTKFWDPPQKCSLIRRAEKAKM